MFLKRFVPEACVSLNGVWPTPGPAICSSMSFETYKTLTECCESVKLQLEAASLYIDRNTVAAERYNPVTGA